MCNFMLYIYIYLHVYIYICFCNRICHGDGKRCQTTGDFSEISAVGRLTLRVPKRRAQFTTGIVATVFCNARPRRVNRVLFEFMENNAMENFMVFQCVEQLNTAVLHSVFYVGISEKKRYV